jgi:hypothetical protein
MVAALSLKERNSDVVNQAINQLQQGRDNASGTVTLAGGIATTTVVPAVNCSPTSGVQLTPITADAAAAIATTYISAVLKGQFTITHVADNVHLDRTFFYRVHGGN